jgi:predicted nucleotidyltransferase
MIRDDDRQVVERLKRSFILHGVPLDQTIVFGSRVRGDVDADSDLDVLVLVQYVNPEIRKTVSHCAWEVGFEAGLLIQTVVMTRAEAEDSPEQSSLLMLAVKAEGIVV